MWRNVRIRPVLLGGALFLLLALLSGCAQPTASQVAGRYAPPDLQRGPTPPGGPSADITGGGAGGSAAAGVPFGHVGGIEPVPVAPAYPPGRMAPNGADGSGEGDRGYDVSPDQPPVYPVVAAPRVAQRVSRP